MKLLLLLLLLCSLPRLFAIRLVFIESSSGRFARDYKNIENHMGLIFVGKCNKVERIQVKMYTARYVMYSVCVCLRSIRVVTVAQTINTNNRTWLKFLFNRCCCYCRCCPLISIPFHNARIFFSVPFAICSIIFFVFLVLVVLALFLSSRPNYMTLSVFTLLMENVRDINWNRAIFK